MNPSLIDPEFLVAMSTQLDQHTVMLELYNKSSLTTGFLLSVQGISQITGELKRDPTLVQECFTFLDKIDALSMFYSSGPDVFSLHMANAMANSRHVSDPKLNTNGVTDAGIVVNNSDDLVNVLSNNRPILAMLLFTLLKSLISGVTQSA